MFDQLSAFQGEEHQPFFWNGGRPAALLVHGFPGTPAEMRPVAQLLHDQGWTVQGVLLPGFGPDISTLADRSAADWTAAVSSALEDLAKLHSPVILVGHSMGGAIALQAAATHPVNALVLLSPFYRLTGGGPIRFAWPLIRRLIPEFKPFRLFKPDFDDPRMREGMAQFLPGADLDDPSVRQAIVNFAIPTRVIDQAITAGRRGYEAAPAVAAPVLIVQGTRDQLVRPERTRELASRLGGKVSYHELDGDHDLTQPDLQAWQEVKALVSAFAGELGMESGT